MVTLSLTKEARIYNGKKIASLTKEPRIYNTEKTASSISCTGKTELLNVEE